MIYEPLLQTRIRHAYFPQGHGGVLQIVPTPQCQKQLKRFKLLFRQVEDGFLVLYARYEGEATSALDEETHFQFVVYVNDPEFLNYSALPIDPAYGPGKGVYYFDNRKKASSAQTPLWLHEKATVSEKDWIPLRPKRFSVTLPTNASKLEVRDAQQNVLFSKTGCATEETIDLFGKPDGIYSVKMGRMTRRYFLVSKSHQRLPLALVDIFTEKYTASKTVTQAYNFLSSETVGKVDFKTYDIFFDNRKTKWKYHINLGEGKIDGMPLRPSELFIDEGQSQIQFIPCESTQIPGDQIACFVSRRKLPLTQQGSLKELTLKYGKTEAKVLREFLPNPESSALVKEERDWVSNVYLYIAGKGK